MIEYGNYCEKLFESKGKRTIYKWKVFVKPLKGKYSSPI